MKHVILMRYNLRYPGFKLSSDPDWIARRCDLFEKRMKPSLHSQTNQDFVCVPLMDRVYTPDDLYKRVESWRCDVIKPMWFGEHWAENGVMYDSPPLWGICEAAVNANADEMKTGDILITTRLDSDDAIHEEFVDTVQKEARPNTLEWLNPTNGWLEKDGLVYPDTHGKSMFISLVEPWNENSKPRTVHRVWHKKASSMAPVRQIGGHKRLWLRGIHGENKSSKIRGRNTMHEPMSFDRLKAHGFHVEE